ncbi:MULTISPECIES: DUF389 domain-containing protein [Dactylosporangium]|uniref:Hydrophobic protein (TIGR00271 family) n=2 Tax=Dactylosporangium TaxID=35753 RepID=A0A9W6KNM5_9ACTN|nr:MULTISPECIES: DUF389 domain-containing protein [Dactylosporangium]UAB93544.1 DUF389 domain-containing protein [Dactylosporangium vinaceum]UWZ41932.1 DUF389 domain-containing protein [Dactylosporangium matsuzakiense]GLL04402.1 hypothetical protein GCM10017581_061490 [Dactylosporangium matsuzakiense]
MLHLRVISPPEATERVVGLLNREAGATNVIVMPGAAREPAGDVVLADVVRESASPVLSALRELGIEERGSIAIENVDVSLSRTAERAADAAPGLSGDAVVWDEIEQKTGQETELSGTFLAMLAIATVIAGIGVLLDQPILIVGAMVVGPEFGPLASLCVGIVRRRGRPVRRALVALAVGFPAAIAVTVLTTWGLDLLGLVDKGMLLRDRPLTDFIWRPDALSWVVGFFAGVAGMLSLTSAKAGPLIGVLISVTTVPAAANIAVALAYGVPHEAGGSALQLLINLAAIVVAGVATLLVLRTLWRTGRKRHA